MTIFDTALNLYSKENRIDKAIEECAELIDVLIKYKQDRANVWDVMEEIAGVEITVMNQLKKLFDIHVGAGIVKYTDVLQVQLMKFKEQIDQEIKMRSVIYPCCVCQEKQGVHKHHCFPQTKVNIRIYGRRLIDADFNIRHMCAECHSSHAKVPKSLIWSEKKFRAEAGRAGFDLLDMGSKTFKVKQNG